MANLDTKSASHLAFAALICAVIAGAVYLPALAGGLVWDDGNALKQSAEIRTARDVIIPPAAVPRIYYRPVVYLSYIADTALGAGEAYWYHLSSLVLHVANTLLVLLLAWRWSPNAIVAAGGALLFAVFPTHVESVAWLSGRSDLVMTTFLLIAALLHLRGTLLSAALGGIALLLALLSKEAAVAAVILFPLLDWVEGRFRFVRCLPAALATVAYFALRRIGVGAFVGGESQPESTLNLVIDLVRAVGFYVVQAFVPISVNPYYATVPEGTVYLIIGVLVPIAAVAAAVWLYRSSTDTRTRVALACLALWFIATLAPTLFVIVRRSALNLLADRYLYAPSVASCIVLAWVLDAAARRLGAQATGSAVAITGAALLFGMQTVAYIPVWADDVSLWTAAAANEERAALPHRELATALLVKGDIDAAEQSFRMALERTSDLEGRVMIYSNLGNLYRRKSQYALAVDSFQKGIEIAPHPTLFHNLGMTEMALAQRASMGGEPQLALAHANAARDALQRALQMGSVAGTEEAFFQWEPAKTHALLGQVLFSLGDRNGAQRHFDEALRLQPAGPVADMTRQFMQRVMQ